MKKTALIVSAAIMMLFLLAGISYADRTYVIKKGDNPYDIAKKFKVDLQDLIKANKLDPSHLRPGRKIRIPSDNKGHTAGAKVAKEKKSTQVKEAVSDHATERQGFAHNNAKFHTVRKGDTLLAIARKHSVSVDQLKEMNNISSSRLKIGQKIILRQDALEDYTVRKGDTVWSIARRFDRDPDELMEINGLETDSLQIGQKILLKPAQDVKEQKVHDAILSQARISDLEIERFAPSENLNEMGMQDRLILFAKRLLDIPYRFGGNSVMGIDCSAYVKKVYSLIGVDLPRSARQQFEEGEPVDADELSIGDLVFFRTYASFPSHVGIYLGNNLFIHASSKSKKVTIDSLDTPYYIKRFIGAKRLLEGDQAQNNSGSDG